MFCHFEGKIAQRSFRKIKLNSGATFPINCEKLGEILWPILSAFTIPVFMTQLLSHMCRGPICIDATNAPVPLGRISFPIVHDRDKFSNREQSETNRNDENVMCDYLSEYLRKCFRLYEDSSRPFLGILRTFCERSEIAED